MARNICLTVAYDGAAYFGWQKTQKGPSIEGTLQSYIEQILQEPVQLQAASRTDAGVHAVGQVVNFFIGDSTLSLSKFQRSLNRLLPKDIVVREIEEKEISFHPTLINKGKEYHYRVCYGPVQLPHRRLYSWHYHYPLDLKLIEESVKILVGRHDFASFCNQIQLCHYEDTFREITQLDVKHRSEESLKFVISGHNFLYKMIRNIIGTVIYIGGGKLPPDRLSDLLHSPNRTKAGVTAPAHGLTLYKVKF